MMLLLALLCPGDASHLCNSPPDCSYCATYCTGAAYSSCYANACVGSPPPPPSSPLPPAPPPRMPLTYLPAEAAFTSTLD